MYCLMTVGREKDKLESKVTVLLFALTLEKVSHWRLRVTDEIVSVPVSPMGCHQDSCVPPERSQSHCPLSMVPLSFPSQRCPRDSHVPPERSQSHCPLSTVPLSFPSQRCPRDSRVPPVPVTSQSHCPFQGDFGIGTPVAHQRHHSPTVLSIPKSSWEILRNLASQLSKQL